MIPRLSEKPPSPCAISADGAAGASSTPSPRTARFENDGNAAAACRSAGRSCAGTELPSINSSCGAAPLLPITSASVNIRSTGFGLTRISVLELFAAASRS